MTYGITTRGLRARQPKTETPRPEGKMKFCLTHKELFHDIPGIMKGCYSGNEFRPCSGRYYEAYIVPVEDVEERTDRGW